MNNNTYKITVIYDNETPKVFEFSSEHVANTLYTQFCIDLGHGKVVATYNLELPNGKMFTKHYDASGFIGGK
jgi:hypothetical protein